MTRVKASSAKQPLSVRQDAPEAPPPSWHKYVRAPSGTVVKPVKIVADLTLGNVTNPEALLENGGAVTILSREPFSPSMPTVVVDFGKVVVGKFQIDFAGATSNSPGIRLAFSESLQYLSNISDFSRSNNGDTITPGSDQIAVGPTPTTWIDTHGCAFNGSQVCADGLHGFRYVRIYLDALPSDFPYTEPNGTVLIDAVSLNWSAYLGTPDTYNGNFECSDEQLNQWWYDGSYTNEVTIDTFRANDTDPRNSASPSLMGKIVIHDGAKRDRDPYVGDLAVAGRTLYLTHDISIAARNVLADLADHQSSDGWIPPASINNYTLPLLDYPLWWVTCSYDYYLYTGDTEYIQTYYQTLLNVLDTFYPNVTSPTTNLVNKGVAGTSGFGDYAFLNRAGAITYINALYVLALNNAASIASFINTESTLEDAKRWKARATLVATALNENNFDSSVGAYVDSSFSTSQVSHPQDGNSLAIISGVAGTDRALSALSYLNESTALPYGNAFYDNDVVGDGFSKRVYAFISYFEISARFEKGMPDSGIEEIRRLYGWMSTQDPGITMWEGIGANGSKYFSGFTSLAHGWSTGVVPILSNYVLGVVPTGPGFSSWSVKPILPADITFAKGQVMTPKGPLVVSWNMGNPTTAKGLNGFAFHLSVQAPRGTKGTISAPLRLPGGGNVSPPVIHLNGVQVDDAVVADGYASIQVDGGRTHDVTVAA